MAGNRRLADAIRQAGSSTESLAERVGADPKTVRRWVSDGRVPHPRTREKVASVLSVPVALLWPGVPGTMEATTELVGIYTTRSEVSPATVKSLADAATAHIDVLAYAALWLWDSVPGFGDTLVAKASAGVPVRICLGDPASEAVLLRGDEEGIGEGLAYRCRIAAKHAAAVARVEPGSVRVSGKTLYASIFRFDDEVLWNVHLWGNPAGSSPVLHLRRRDDRGVAASVMASFDRVWEDAQAVGPG